MSHAADTITTAEELFAVMKEMPTGERVRFFTLLGKNAFEKENFTHEEVFGDVLNSEFTAAEAAAYMELIGHEGTIHDDPPPAEEPLSADPDDEYLLDLARAAVADVLVSGDSHLLVLRDVVPVMTPAEFLASLADR